MGNLYDRIKSTIRNLLRLPTDDVKEEEIEWSGEDREVGVSTLPKAGYLQEAEAVAIIRKAAANRLLVSLQYSGQVRNVEPYSFRQGAQGLLFYGHDLYRNDTRSYYVHKIEQVQLTDIPYNPRWMVEIG